MCSINLNWVCFDCKWPSIFHNKLDICEICLKFYHPSIFSLYQCEQTPMFYIGKPWMILRKLGQLSENLTELSDNSHLSPAAASETQLHQSLENEQLQQIKRIFNNWSLTFCSEYRDPGLFPRWSRDPSVSCPRQSPLGGRNWWSCSPRWTLPQIGGLEDYAYCLVNKHWWWLARLQGIDPK